MYYFSFVKLFNVSVCVSSRYACFRMDFYGALDTTYQVMSCFIKAVSHLCGPNAQNTLWPLGVMALVYVTQITLAIA